jgi:hypothetical protein
MSQAPRLTRARQLTASVWPGKDGSASPGGARLRKLAAAGSTGVLPFTGPGDGAIYVRGGRVVHAESARTPGPVVATELATPADRLTAALALAEPAVDAVADLLSGDSRPARFRSAAVPPVGLAAGIPVDALLAEVARRQRVTRQLAAIVTADTTVVRNPHPGAQDVRVSALQWALLIRVRRGATPRDLAGALSRSVFGTTIEVYRLLALRLLTVPRPAAPAGSPPRVMPGPGPVPLSFIRAAADKKGGSMPDHVEAGPAGPAAGGAR